MGTYVTPQGLAIPTLQDLLDKTAQELRDNIDANLNTDADSPLGGAVKIVMSHIREAWEALDIAFNANNPDAAEDFLLDCLCAITGTRRAAATRSTFRGSRKLKVNLNITTTLPIGTLFQIPGDPSTEFRTTEEITSTTAGDYYVAAECTKTGPVVCNAGTLTYIVTPVVGLNSVVNENDAVLGLLADNNTTLRARREQELRATGSGTLDSMRSDVLAIEIDNTKPVLDCQVFENVTGDTDANGLPGHAMEVLVFDGVIPAVSDTTLAQVIWDSKPGGIQMYGLTSAEAVDSLGGTRIVYFTRPTMREIQFQATLTLTNAHHTPSQYLAEVQKAIIAAFSKRVKMGGTIRVNHYESACLAIPGVEDCVIRLGYMGDPLLPIDTNLALGHREMGYVQTTGITVA